MSEKKQSLENKSSSHMNIMHAVATLRDFPDVIDLSRDDDQCSIGTNVISNQQACGNDLEPPHHISQVNVDRKIIFDEEQTQAGSIPSTMLLNQQGEVEHVKISDIIQYYQQTMNGSSGPHDLSQEFTKHKPSQMFVLHDSKFHLLDINQITEEDEVFKTKQKPLSEEQSVNAEVLKHTNFHVKNDMNTNQSNGSVCNEIVTSNDVSRDYLVNQPSEELILPHSLKMHAVSHKQLLEKFSRVKPKPVRTKKKPSIIRRPANPNILVKKNLELESMDNTPVTTPMTNGIITSATLDHEFSAIKATELFGPCDIQGQIGDVSLIKETLNQVEYEPVKKKQKMKPRNTELRRITSILDLRKEVAELRESIITLKANQRQEVRKEVCRVLQNIFSPEIVQNLLNQKDRDEHSDSFLFE